MNSVSDEIYLEDLEGVVAVNVIDYVDDGGGDGDDDGDAIVTVCAGDV